MSGFPSHSLVFCLLALLLSNSVDIAAATTDVQVGQFVKYRLTEQIGLPGTSPVSQNVTETVVEILPNGTIVRFQFELLGLIPPPIDEFFPNGSMIFPRLGLDTLNSPNATVAQIRESFNLTFIQANTTRTSNDFTLTRKDISFNGSLYSGNLYSGTIAMTVNVTQALNLTENILPLPLNIDVLVHTFSSDLVYNLTATSIVNLGFSQATAKAQMILLSTNLSLGDPISPVPWYAALALIVPLGILGYVIYRRRRARSAAQSSGKKPSYWVH